MGHAALRVTRQDLLLPQSSAGWAVAMAMSHYLDTQITRHSEKSAFQGALLTR